MEHSDFLYMKMAFEHARFAVGKTQPNPAVGAVIVEPKSNRVMGTGFTQKVGSHHAEIMAIQMAKKKLTNLQDCTLYVTLEPCCHQGRTPPCTQAIIAERISRVVIGRTDPSAKVDGKSVTLLKEKGINVEILDDPRFEKSIFYSLGGFISLEQKTRPMVILKWAQTKKGFLSPRNGPSGAISGVDAKEAVFRLRSLFYATLVTPGTIKADRPSLTARLNTSEFLEIDQTTFLGSLLRSFNEAQPEKTFEVDPLKIFLMPRLGDDFLEKDLVSFLEKQKLLPGQSWFLFSDARQKLLFSQYQLEAAQVANYELAHLLPILAKKKISTLLIEAGPNFSQKYLKSDLVDLVMTFESQNAAPFLEGWGNDFSFALQQGQSLEPLGFRLFDELKFIHDHLWVFRSINSY